MHRLIPVVFNDDWGSHVSIASVTGRRIPTEQPESELWMGAHEAGPAGLVDGPHATLLDLVAADPSGTLGELADEFGVLLIADGFGLHIPKGYLYFALGFSIAVEALNHWMRRKRRAH